MKKFLISFILILSGPVIADEIPDIVKQDPMSLEWNWSYYAKDPLKTIAYMADFTKQEKISDGTIFLPWLGWDFKANKFTTRLFWSRINCDKNSVDSPGVFEKGLFSEPTPTVYSENSIGAAPKHMICGITTQDGDKIFGLFANVDQSSIVWWGWTPDKIKKEDIQDSQVRFNLYQYNLVTKQKGFTYSYTADCSNKKIIVHSENVPALDLNNKKNLPWLYTYNSVCALRDKLSNQPAKITDFQKSEVQPVTENKKLTIEQAKVKCTDLGFEAKTEKFGNCVLELMK